MPKAQPIEQSDFSGGVNAVTNPHKVTEKQVARIRNLILDEHTAMRTRDGFAVVTTSPDHLNPILLRDVLNTVNQTSTPYALQAKGIPVANLNLYSTNTTPWTLSDTIPTTETLPQAVTAVNTAILAVGYQVPRQWTGTGVTTAITATAGQTVPAGAKHIAFHLGSLWVWNTAQNTSTLDGSSSLRMSDPNNPNSWPNANQTFISKDDGQVGTGLATFTIAETGISPTQTLVCFKNYSAYQVIGVFGSSNFSIQKIKSDMGCVAPRSIQFVSGFGIIRLTHKGFALFDGVDDKLISEEVRPYLFGRDDISPINFNNVTVCWASQSQNPPLYICGAPVTGTFLERFFIYDLVRKAWTICDYPTLNIQCLSLFNTPTTSPVVHAGTTTSGKIVQLFNGDLTDGGADIPWSFRTRDYFAKSAVELTYWRRFIMEAGVTKTIPITISASFTGPTSVITQNRNFSGTVNGAIWGQGTWGQFIWGSTLNDTRQDIDLQVKACSVLFNISGSGAVRIRTLQAQAVSQPMTKAIQ